MNYRNIPFSIKALTIFFLLRMVFFQWNVALANPDSIGIYKPINPLYLVRVALKQDTTMNRITIEDNNTKKKSKESIYSRIRNNAERNYATRKLYGLFFRKQDLEIAGRVFDKSDATNKFITFSGKRINEIELVKLNAFGQSVYDSTLKPTTWIENKTNSLHIRTANFIIKNSLLFREGDKVNPVDFAESEELLRNLNYIEDANIFVELLADSTKVNIKVITKDAWSIGIDARMNNTHSSQVEIYDKNLGGLGLELNGSLYQDTKKTSEWGHKVELSATNIGGSFIHGNIWFRQGQGFDTYALSFKRNFYASNIHYGGGASIIKSNEPYSFKNIDSTKQIGYRGYDFWLGRSFRVSRKDILKAPHNLVFSFRYISKYYSIRPEVLPKTNYPFQNKEYYLVGLSLTQQILYKANLIYAFGKTEDIPTGFRVHFTTGYEKGEFENRFYIGNELSAAEVGSWGYLYSSARAGSFLLPYHNAQQITLNLRTTYFSNLFSISRFELRQFVRVDYTRGLSRYYGEGEQIFLDENNGIRGLTSREMSGTTRFVLNLETVAFSPLFVFGFRFAYFAFCDLGFIGPADDYLIGNQYFSGFGIGVRIRNENLVLNTFQFRFGFYPKLPVNPDVTYWLVTGQQKTTFENFRGKEPQIIPFE